jgi:endonuclease/exonuclease/phosphatase (EEP) superfamily protein YafD
MAARRTNSFLASGGRTFAGLTLITVGFLATLGTLLGFLGGQSWALDVLSSFRVQYFLVLLIVAVLYGAFFSRIMSLLFVAMAAINLILIAPLYLDNPAPSDSPEPLSIVSFNVQSRSSNRDQIMRWIERADPDLVFLLESNEGWEEYAATLETYRLRSQLPVDRSFGITMLSREEYPVELLRVGEIRDSVLRVEASIDGQAVIVLAVHARPPSTSASAAARNEVLEEVTKLARAETLPVIVVGDLNATPWSAAFHALASDAELVNSLNGYGFQASWPGDLWTFLRIPIDHLLHSPELTAVKRMLGPSFGSDHRPLYVSVGLANQ